MTLSRTETRTDLDLRVPIGAVVRAWREWHGCSVTELARVGGPPLTKGYISELERDKIHHPKDRQLALLANALRIPVLYLITRHLPDAAADQEDTRASPGVPRQISASNLSLSPTDRTVVLLQPVDRLIAALQSAEGHLEEAAGNLREARQLFGSLYGAQALKPDRSSAALRGREGVQEVAFGVGPIDDLGPTWGRSENR